VCTYRTGVVPSTSPKCGCVSFSITKIVLDVSNSNGKEVVQVEDEGYSLHENVSDNPELAQDYSQ